LIDSELLAVAFKNLKARKLRSYLTLLGIVIGIAAIVALVSIGEGLNQAVTQQFEQLGLNTLIVEPGSGGFVSMAVARTLREEDERLIEGIAGVEAVIGFYEAAAVAEFKNGKSSVFIIGFDPKKMQYLEKMGYSELTKGRKLQPSDKYSVMLTEGFAANGFVDETLRVKDSLEINGQKFKIIGITKDMSGFMGGGMMSNFLFMPKKTVQDFFSGNDPTELIVEVTDKSIADEVAEKIKTKLLRAHGEEDFYVMTTENVMESAGVVLGLIQLVLVGLAAISLLVGGIGIMNTMLMSVMERTTEIGTMKAIGATNSRVLSIFLAEAALLGATGGLIGSIFGIMIAAGVSVVATASGFPLPIAINPLAFIGAIAFAMAVGMLSGYYPARRAALLEPVAALRYAE